MYLFYLLIAVMPLYQHPLWQRLVLGISLIKCLGLLCLIYAAYYAVFRRRSLPPYFRTGQAWLFVAFYAIAAVSWFAHPLDVPSRAASDVRAGALDSFTAFFILWLTTVPIVDSCFRLRRVLWAAAASPAIASVYLIREWQVNRLIWGDFRPGWITGDSNLFALSAVIFLPLAFSFLLEHRTGLYKAFWLGCVVLTLAAFTLAASRGGFLGLSAATAVMVWRSKKKTAALGIVLFMALFALAMPMSPVSRLLNPSNSDSRSSENRLIVWRAGLDMIRAHPLTGVGLGQFRATVTDYENSERSYQSMAHNSYLEIAAELGIPALLVFLGLLICTHRTLGQICERTNKAGPVLLHRTAEALNAGLLGTEVGIFFCPGLRMKSLWFLLFLAMCLPAIARGRQAKHSGLAARHPETGEDQETALVAL